MHFRKIQFCLAAARNSHFYHKNVNNSLKLYMPVYSISNDLNAEYVFFLSNFYSNVEDMSVLVINVKNIYSFF